VKQPLELRYGPPSCRTKLAMQRRDGGGAGCQRVMGGVGTCPEE
jgi:hypothetical protein